MELQEIKEKLKEMYGGENKPITDGNYDPSLAVKFINGTFVGRKTENITVFRGIPYVGKQPVGELRWKAPVDVTPCDGVYEAYYNSKSAYGNPGFEVGSIYYQDEDCLYLNVWRADECSARPKDACKARMEKKPVMVWIHGGAFESGGTIDPMFDCINFVKENPDVIVVTIAYRLAFMGFLHLSHLSDGKDYTDSQNLGLLDQVKALKWVHENIAAFGGDPDNVTIFGESAGAGSCTLIPLIPGSHQYFKRVIAQSGAPAQTRSTGQAIACTDNLMEVLGCKTVADLLNLSADELMKAWAPLLGLYNVLGIRTFPERDGKYLPLNPWEAYANGAAKDIGFLQGCDKDEMNTFMGALGVDAWNAWAGKRTAEKLAQLTDKEKALVGSYLNDIQGKSYEPTVNLFSQMMFIAPQIRLSDEQTKAGGRCTPTTTGLNPPSRTSRPDMRQSCPWYSPIRRSGSSREEHTTKPSRRPCARCGYSLPRPATRRSAPTSPPTARRSSGRSTT